MEDIIKLNLNRLDKNFVNNYEVTTRDDGTMVVPVTLMVEGVHHGSRGPMLYTAEELGDRVAGWNGMPIVVNHPSEPGGEYISANDPSIEDQVVGRLYNAQMVGTRLRAEAHIKPDRLRGISPEALQRIIDNKPMEVSVGVLSHEEQVPGEWHGEAYRAIARELSPDHLALLPEATGACSYDDGCGIRNEETLNNNESETKGIGGPTENENLKKEKVNPRLDELFVNETGFREIGMTIQGKLDAMDNASNFYFLEEIYEDHFIYRVANRESNSSRFFKQSYSVNEETNEVEFSGDATAVRKQVTYEAIENEQELTRNKFSNSKKKTSMSKVQNTSPCLVSQLIENEATSWTEGEREYLTTLEDDILKKMIPVVKVVNKEEDEPVRTKKPSENEEGPKPIVAKVTAEQIKEVLKGEDASSFIDNFLPDGLKGQMNSGMKMYKEKRDKLIERVVANSSFEKEELSKWEDSALEKMADSISPKVDYSVLGADQLPVTVNEDDDEEAESMLHLEEDKK